MALDDGVLLVEVIMRENRTSLFAIAGGLLHIALAGSLLVLPVFAICLPQGQALVCEHQTYLQQGGNLIGLGFLLLMIVAGVIAIFSTRLENPSQVRRLRWLAVAITVGFMVIGAWGIGLFFIPGGILLLLSALLYAPDSFNPRKI